MAGLSCGSKLTSVRGRFVQIREDFTWINPHLSLELIWESDEYQFEATDPNWHKWLPSDPTSAHWYDVERLERLAGAYVAQDQNRRTVRDFIADFRGMARSATQKTILDATGLSRKPLAELFPDDKPDHGTFAKLLTKLQDATKPVRAKDLGIIGEDHLAETIRGCAGDSDFTFKYQKVLIDGAVPAVIEVAFSYIEGFISRQIITGVNWSVGIVNPFRQIRYDGLDGILNHLRVGPEAAVAVVIHLAYPRATYTDRGKSALALPGSIADALVKALTAVTADWTRQVKREERDASAQHNRLEKLNRSRRVTVKAASWDAMPAAYQKASSNGTLPANARQMMYAARPQIEERTGKKLDDTYFTQTLLPDYIEETGVDWDVVYDDRGHFREPHTDHTFGLGTLAVRRYLESIHPIKFEPPSFSPGKVVTRGPQGCYRGVMFVEKEGFDPLWHAVDLAERFDLAIKSTKGMSVTAARRLADELAGKYGVPLLILHDFDKSGFSILGTLGRDGRRYKFKHKIEIIDLGLRLEDIDGLPTERSSDKGDRAVRALNLSENGATAEEIGFLLDRRVELNAMTSRQLVDFVEHKLKANGFGEKIVPSDETLADAFKLFASSRQAEKLVEHELQRMNADPVDVPGDLAERVRRYLIEHPTMRWDDAVGALLKNGAELRKEAKR